MKPMVKDLIVFVSGSLFAVLFAVKIYSWISDRIPDGKDNWK